MESDGSGAFVFCGRRRHAALGGMPTEGGASLLLYKKKISRPVRKLCNGASPCVGMDASYTVEMAVAIPFFTGFMVVLLFFFQALSVQQEVGNALLSTGRSLAVLECLEDGSMSGGVLGAKALVVKNLKKDSAADQFIRGGRLGISLLGSDFSGNYVSLSAEYKIRLPIGLFGKQDIKMSLRLKCRKWTGGRFDEADEELVYITQNGAVYHRKQSCSYLSPSVRAVSGNSVLALRNADGGKYYPCAKCMAGKMAQGKTVYVTNYGSRFHAIRNCSKIRRVARAVHLSEVKGRRACTKCGRR